MSNNMHRPAAAWSRDSLAAWQWMIDKTDPQSGIGTSPTRSHEMFLRRWAIKILSLVSDEMPYSDWYWFLNDHFHKELFRRWPGTTERLNEFRNPNTRETDPAGEEPEFQGVSRGTK